MPEIAEAASQIAHAVVPLEPIKVRAKFFFEGEKKWFIKGVTYGPFAPDAQGDFVGDPEKARRDFALMQELGINLLRIYHVPPRWFLDVVREFRLRVPISIPCARAWFCAHSLGSVAMTRLTPASWMSDAIPYPAAPRPIWPTAASCTGPSSAR